MLSKQLDGIEATLESILDFNPDEEDDSWISKQVLMSIKDKVVYVREQLN